MADDAVSLEGRHREQSSIDRLRLQKQKHKLDQGRRLRVSDGSSPNCLR
ncbi:hypothetical protein SAMN04489802_2112 [Pseudomonas chlororaphis]|nr:hypothetical protein SAMN04489802_2112 [Pseudomonas chlororaphis]